MKFLVKSLGWLLFAASTFYTVTGMLALADMVGSPAWPFDLAITNKNDRVLWVVAWLLGMLGGLWLAKPQGKREVEH